MVHPIDASPVKTRQVRDLGAWPARGGAAGRTAKTRSGACRTRAWDHSEARMHRKVCQMSVVPDTMNRRASAPVAPTLIARLRRTRTVHRDGPGGCDGGVERH